MIDVCTSVHQELGPLLPFMHLNQERDKGVVRCNVFSPKMFQMFVNADCKESSINLCFVQTVMHVIRINGTCQTCKYDGCVRSWSTSHARLSW